MRRLTWFFGLRNNFVTQSRAMSAGLGRIRTQLQGSGRDSAAAARAIAGSFGVSTAAARRLVGALVAVGAASRHLASIRAYAQNAYSSLSGLIGRLTSLPNLLLAGAAGLTTKAIFDALGFKEQQLISLRVMLRPQFGADAGRMAQETYAMLARFAAQTPFETQEVLAGGKQLLAAGVNVKNLQGLLKDAGDLASAMGVRLEDAISPLTRLRSGNFGEAFERLRELGISRELLEAQGLKFDKGGSYVGSVNKAMLAVRQIIQKRFGGLMEEQSTSIFGLMSTLKSRPFELFSQMDVGDGGPLKPFKQMLSNLAALTDFSQGPGAAISRRFQDSLGRLMQATFGPLASATEPKKAGEAILGFLDRTALLAQKARQYFPLALGYARQFWAGVQTGLGALQGVWKALEPGIALLGHLARGFSANQAGLAGTNAGGLALMGTLLVLTTGLRLLNTLTFGLAGTLLRLGLVWVATAARMAGGWLLAMGPVGWVIALVGGLVAAVVLAYKRLGWFRDGVNGVWQAIITKGGELIAWISTLPETIRSALANLPGLMLEIGRNAITGLWNGLKAAPGKIWEAAKGLAVQAVGGARAGLEVRSPSRALARIGEQSGLGLERGLLAMRGVVAGAGLALATAAIPAAPQMPAAVIAAGAGASAATVTREVHVHIGNIVLQQAQTPSEARTLVVEAILEALERAAIEEGA
ncbi:hypothetical protein [Meiothermus ruber]|uniref:Phage tail tape measure protein n=1 Tax=Meiothermus ruber (strain ATCC 35948 / DSM 1279 / VKM B-1258 / 21) TaxID=504728 RepID=D3PTC5_MEIRD|nr:hypothetical protein [Meiothermus ruber]ADD28708.1 hypothetical protein Mrub_1952 [Meiothermus ruber DSM 1279]AGK05846.1 hypothetical protein K649_12800 [Meiothermus ruber DSM 1279]